MRCANPPKIMPLNATSSAIPIKIASIIAKTNIRPALALSTIVKIQSSVIVINGKMNNHPCFLVDANAIVDLLRNP